MGAEALSLSRREHPLSESTPVKPSKSKIMKGFLVLLSVVVFICALQNANGQDSSLENKELEGRQDLLRKTREALPKKKEASKRRKHNKRKSAKSKKKRKNNKRKNSQKRRNSSKSKTVPKPAKRQSNSSIGCPDIQCIINAAQAFKVEKDTV